MRTRVFGVVVCLLMLSSSIVRADECGRIPAAAQKVLEAIGAKYPELRKGTDAQRRDFTLRAAQQLAFSISPEWGTKRSKSGHPQSKDSVTRHVRGMLCNWDIINGTTRELMFHSGEDITGQVFIPVTPKDHLNGQTPTIPRPPTCPDCPDPTPCPKPEPCQTCPPDQRERVAALEAQLAEWDQRLRDCLATRESCVECKNFFGIKYGCQAVPCKVVQ